MVLWLYADWAQSQFSFRDQKESDVFSPVKPLMPGSFLSACAVAHFKSKLILSSQQRAQQRHPHGAVPEPFIRAPAPCWDPCAGLYWGITSLRALSGPAAALCLQLWPHLPAKVPHGTWGCSGGAVSCQPCGCQPCAQSCWKQPPLGSPWFRRPKRWRPDKSAKAPFSYVLVLFCLFSGLKNPVVWGLFLPHAGTTDNCGHHQFITANESGL